MLPVQKIFFEWPAIRLHIIIFQLFCTKRKVSLFTAFSGALRVTAMFPSFCTVVVFSAHPLSMSWSAIPHNSPPTADPHPARTFLQRSSLSSFYLLERVFGAMSYAGRTPAPRPPDRGSFPLDHDGECASSMREYLDCMKRARNNNSLCREQSKRYLECRMDR